MEKCYKSQTKTQEPPQRDSSLGDKLYCHVSRTCTPCEAGFSQAVQSIADYLIAEYGKAGVSVEDLVNQQIDAAGVSLTYDEAFEEIVCDAANAFRKLDKNVQNILADLFVDMSTTAAERLSTIKAAGMTEKNTTDEGGVRYKNSNKKTRQSAASPLTRSLVKQGSVGSTRAMMPSTAAAELLSIDNINDLSDSVKLIISDLGAFYKLTLDPFCHRQKYTCIIMFTKLFIKNGCNYVRYFLG